MRTMTLSCTVLAALVLCSLDSAAADASPSDTSACPALRTALRDDAVFPKEAMQLGVRGGEVTLLFTIARNGRISDVVVDNSLSHRSFAVSALAALNGVACPARAEPLRVRLPVHFVEPANALSDDSGLPRCPDCTRTCGTVPDVPPANRGDPNFNGASVRLHLDLHPDGSISGVSVARGSGYFEIDRLSVNAVKHWKCPPVPSATTSQRVQLTLTYPALQQGPVGYPGYEQR